MKYKPAFERDYLFYLQNRFRFKFAGCSIPVIPYQADGVDAKKAFWAFDSQGKLLPCREPELFSELVACKKSVNLHLILWAEGYQDCLIPISELMETFIEPPDWVEESFRNQIQKILKKEKKW